MSKFDDWYHGPEGVKQVVSYKSAKIAWDYQQKRIEELQAQVDVTTTALSEIKATNDGDSDQPIYVILEWCIAQITALKENE